MVKYYWRLRELMAKHGLTQADISNISGLSEVSISKKFSLGQEFKITPAAKIYKHFKDMGESVTFDELFLS